MAGRTLTVGIRIAAEDRTSSEMAKILGSTRGLESGLRRLGVTLDKDANKKLELNRVLLEQAANAYARGTITLGDYNRAQERVAVQNARIKATMDGTAVSARAAHGAFGGLDGSLTGLLSRLAATVVSLSALTRGIRASAEESLSDEKAQTQRAAALARAGVASDEIAASLDRQADSVQRLTDLDDAAIASLQAFILDLGVMPAKVEATTQVVLDLASAFGIQLNAGAKAVAQVLRGEVSKTLASLVPELNGMVAAGNSGAEMFALLEGKVRGATAALAETRAVAIAGLKNDLVELGAAFLTGATNTDEFVAAILRGRGALQGARTDAAQLGEGFSFALQGVPAIINLTTLALLETKQELQELLGTHDETLALAIHQVRVNLQDAGEAAEFASKHGDSFQRALAGVTGGLHNLNLAARIQAQVDQTLAAAQSKAAASSNEMGTAIEITAAKLEKMKAAAAGAGSALAQLGQTLGTVTSVQLADEILQISLQLEAARGASETTGAELARLEDVAGAKIAILRERITSLQQGLGDVAVKAVDVATGLGTAGESFDAAAESADGLTTSLAAQRVELQRVSQQANATAAAIANVGSVSDRINRLSSPELTGRNASGMNRQAGFGTGPSRFVSGMSTYR